MSTRERLPETGLDIGENRTIYETDLGFSVAFAGYWLPGIYQTFEAAEQAFSLSDRDLSVLQKQANQSNRNITLYDIEKELE